MTVKLNGLVLGFSGISSKQIHAGVAGLRQVLDTMKKRNDQPVNPFWYVTLIPQNGPHVETCQTAESCMTGE